MTPEPLAHTGPNGEAHLLHEHLQEVARIAQEFAAPLNSGNWAYLAGLWHDLGKYRPGFQQYIRQVNGQEASIEGKLPSGSEKTHSASGALHALRLLEERFGATGGVLGRALAYVIAGHHAGLGDWVAGFDTRLLGTGAPNSEREYNESHTTASEHAPHLLVLPESFTLPSALAAVGADLNLTHHADPILTRGWMPTT